MSEAGVVTVYIGGLVRSDNPWTLSFVNLPGPLWNLLHLSSRTYL